MDLSCSFCVVASVLYLIAVLWRVKEGGGPGTCGVLCGGALCGGVLCSGGVLFLPVPPVLWGSVLLGCSLVLICDSERRVELLHTRAVLITGCDSGFGLAVARRLSAAGLQVFAGVLHLNGAGAQQLRDEGSGNLQVLQLDVTDQTQVQRVHRDISAQVDHTGLWGLVNNAGVLPCPVDAELQPLSGFSRCLDVNFLSAVRVTQVFLPLLRRSRGRVVNVSSMAAEVPMPSLAAYGASKAALSLFSEVLRLELSVWGVNVALIQPAGFRTKIFGDDTDAARHRDELLAAVSPEAREDYGEAYIASVPDRLSRMSRQSAEDLSPVVDAVCHALLSARPRALYAPGRMAWLLPFLHRCCPTAVFDAVITALTKHADCPPAGLHRR